MEYNKPYREGLLVVEYKGKRFRLTKSHEDDVYFFSGEDKTLSEELNLAYNAEYFSDKKQYREKMEYWYPRPYQFGKKAAESIGSKVIEYKDEWYANKDEEGNPIIY